MAQNFLENADRYSLPLHVPYIGMGSSFFAPLAFKYMGIDIYPEMASEYYNYLSHGKKFPSGVLISQSGRSTEVLWCAELFNNFTAISNNTDSPLCKFPNVESIILLQAGEEQFSSSKTYINTLLALFKGFGVDVTNSIMLLSRKMDQYEQQGIELANKVFTLIQNNQLNGLYITGSGPNIGTAMQASLILSESTKLNFNGMSMAQYDHGPKEAARDSVIINIMSKGKSYERTKKLEETLSAAGAIVLTVEEPAATENESIIHNIIPFNFMAYYLSNKLNIQDTFTVGRKVTEVTL